MDQINNVLLPVVQKINGFLADYILVFLLVGAGIFFHYQNWLCTALFGPGPEEHLW